MTQNAWLISRKRNRPDEYVGYDLPYELAMQYLENMGYRILGESVVGETYEELKTELGRIISENPDVIVFPNLMSVSRQTEEVIEVLELLDRAGVRCEIANDSTAIDTVRIYMKLLNDCYSYVGYCAVNIRSADGDMAVGTAKGFFHNLDLLICGKDR